MKILNVLRLLETVELTMADFYEWLSESFADHDEASGFFFRMSMHEKSHASRLRYAKRLVQGSPSDFAEVTIDEDEISALIARIKAFQDEHPEPSLGEALLFAMKLESEPAENIHSSLIIDSNPDVEAIIRNLAEADAGHHEALKRFVCSHRAEIDLELEGVCP